MFMEIRESFEVNAPRKAVAEVLLDVPTVATCVPGVQDVKQDEGGSWQAVMTAQLGPIKASFAGTIAVDGSEAPQRLRATGEGRDRKTGSQAAVSMVATLSEADEETTSVEVVADVAIRGRLGQFGTGIIRATASEMTKAFAECLAGKVGETPALSSHAPAVQGQRLVEPKEAAPAGRSRTSPSRVGIATVLLRGLRSWMKGLLHRAWAALPTKRKGN
jgi:carbon monoxide dehydrogenase subunit G